ncbi:hypothetical protein HIM_08295 [Hirsutella minnesotensis 3608]|uniref:Ankyrin repeat domain-containing protein 54 n=1 Tax=Hirsutella minnesotensis 3608 TaxID=1043627 RepID=A0A0F8A3T1_9HYPO|nr:hypothetical protein HIM_08295 [Hirsutella minnesotensis 3608]
MATTDSRSSGPMSERHKRRRRSPNELIWTQPRTIPPSVHNDPRRLSTPPLEGPPGKDSKQPQARSSGSVKAPSVPQNMPEMDWKIGADFPDVSAMSDITDDQIDVQTLFQCSSSMTEIMPFRNFTPQSMDHQSCPPDLDANFISYHHIPAPAENNLESKDNSTSSDDMASLDGFSAIHLATHFGQLAIIRLLLSASPEDADLLNQADQAPLHIAASRGHADVTSELLRLGANARKQDADGCTVLHLAVLGGHLETVRTLLDRIQGKGMMNIADGAGKTSLHHAVMLGHVQIVQLLLERGANTRMPIR